MRNRLLVKVLCLVLAAMLSVPFSPGRSWSFSIGEEREVGEKLLYAVRAAFPIIGEPDLHQYLNRLGKEVLEVAGIQYFNYRFYIVESDQFNAFAAPSGLIFFYSRLIESMQTEDELVSVLAHEIGHVVKRHLASRMEKGAKVNLASLAVALAAIALGGGGAGAQALITGSLAAGQSAQLHFSRQDEIEADLLAYNWMKKLHRNPEGQRDMLETMRRITRYRSGQIPQYLLTHPNPEARLDYVESLLLADNDPQPPENPGKDFEFLRFKYRIMALDHDSDGTRALLSRLHRDDKAPDFKRTMALYGLALLERSGSNFSKSLEYLDQVIQKLPNRYILQVDKAITLFEMGQLPAARKLLEEAVKRDPFDMYATFNLARVLHRLGELERAELLFRDVSFELPEYSTVYFEIGKILAEQGNGIESRFFLGKYNLYEGDYRLARDNFRQVVQSDTAATELKSDAEELLELIDRLEGG